MDETARVSNDPEHWINADQFGGYAHVTEMVPVEAMKRFRSQGLRQPIGPLRESIAQHGVMEPLMLMYGQRDRQAYLGEGHHRLAAAEAEGHSHVPVRVQRMMSTWQPGVPVRGITPNEHDYVPADLRPSDIGLPVKEKNVTPRPRW